VAGVGAMNYRRFIAYDVVGGTAWVGLCVLAGYWLGNFETVKNHFPLAIAAVVAVSVMPMVIEYLRSRRQKSPDAE
jgi:membrane-associated protein